MLADRAEAGATYAHAAQADALPYTGQTIVWAGKMIPRVGAAAVSMSRSRNGRRGWQL